MFSESLKNMTYSQNLIGINSLDRFMADMFSMFEIYSPSIDVLASNNNLAFLKNYSLDFDLKSFSIMFFSISGF